MQSKTQSIASSFLFYCLSCYSLILLLPEALKAQENKAKDNDIEVVVTADAQQRNAEEIPSSISVIDQTTLEDRGSSHVQDVLEYIPNLNWAGGSNRPRFFQIRGIGELEQYEGAPNPSVGFLIDDFDFTGLGSIGSLFDVEQVEVLRGPQGLRYGTSGLAGLIHLKSTDPTPYYSSLAQFTLGSDELVSGGAAFGGPVPGSDGKLLFRFAAFQQQSDGFRNNTYLSRDDTNQQDEFTGRATLQYKPSDDLSIELRLLRVKRNDGYDVFTIDNTRTTRSDRPGQDDQTSNAAALKVNYQLSDALAFTSITQFSHSDFTYSYDGDWGNNPFWAPYDPYDYFSITNRNRTNIGQELRLGSQNADKHLGEHTNWFLGLYGFRIAEDTTINDQSNAETYRFLDSAYDATHGAVFGEIEVPVAYRTSSAFGLRVEQRNAEYDDSNLAHFSPNDTMIGGHLSLSHEVSDTAQVYGLLSRGYKGGGFNPGTAVPSERRSYDPEYLWNLETGIKGSFIPRVLDGSIAAFYGWRRDQQIKLAIQNDPSDPLSFTYLTDNASKGTNAGLESDLRWQATTDLELYASGSLLYTRFDEVPAEVANLDDREAAHAPTWQYATGAKYQFTDKLFARIDLTGKDSFYFDDSNDQKTGAYSLLNGAVGWKDNNWSLTLWAKNILDKRYAVRGFYFGDEPPDFENERYIQRGDPLQVGITAAVYF